MPRIKRWFPVNHNINRDPEVWEMRRQIGEKSLSIWLEFLSIADQHEGEVPGAYELLVRSIAGTCQATVRTVSAVYQYAISKVWMKSEPTLHIVKYWNYHKPREPKETPKRFPPDLPDLPDFPKEDKNIAQQQKSVAPPAPWPAEDLWLKKLVSEQPFFNHAITQLSDFAWWEDVATSINGIDPQFIGPEFAKMSAWLRENPGRKPTAKGARRFVRSWLERARDHQRRLYAVKK